MPTRYILDVNLVNYQHLIPTLDSGWIDLEDLEEIIIKQPKLKKPSCVDSPPTEPEPVETKKTKNQNHQPNKLDRDCSVQIISYQITRGHYLSMPLVKNIWRMPIIEGHHLSSPLLKNIGRTLVLPYCCRRSSSSLNYIVEDQYITLEMSPHRMTFILNEMFASNLTWFEFDIALDLSSGAHDVAMENRGTALVLAGIIMVLKTDQMSRSFSYSSSSNGCTALWKCFQSLRYMNDEPPIVCVELIERQMETLRDF
ncbi:hypothetical protein Dsin_020597 [Dipteronia sinensis]|uniref:Uncharacterized protein n=1 Tax=Dipteronia sinensis TaxID=43782 RepID=A0AAE0AAV0_9ROSI|nr:hypothetical protein Dsin_020597 [Dipteronia sinensis]